MSTENLNLNLGATDETILELATASSITETMFLTSVDTADHTMDPTGTNLKFTPATMVTYFNGKSLSPFTAKITGNGQLESAVTAGKQVINLATNITLTANLQLTADTIIVALTGAQISSAGYRIDKHAFSLTFIGESQFTTMASYAPNNPGETFIYDALGDHPTAAFSQINCRIINSGSLADTPVFANCNYIAENAFVRVGSADNAGVRIRLTNSTIKNLKVVSLLSPDATSSFLCDVGTCNIEGLELINGSSVAGVFAQIQELNYISQMDISGGSTTEISIDCTCSQLISTDGTLINLTIASTNTHISDSTVNNLDASASTDLTLTGCHADGIYSSGTGTEAAGCTGSIINTSDVTDIDYFQAGVDGVGVLTNYYATYKDAFTAGKTYNAITENVTETSSLTLGATQQASSTVQQNKNWNLSTFSIDASAGAIAFSVFLSDPSSVFSFTDSPITGLDANSTLALICNGGGIHNNSAVDDVNISCGGAAIYRDAYFLLPNASNGGIASNPYSVLDNIQFVGGGVACDKAFVANGGMISNTFIYGTFSNQALLNDATAPFLWSGALIDLDSPNSITVSGHAWGITKNSANLSSVLTYVVQSGTTIVSCESDYLTFASGVTDVLVFVNEVIGGVVLSNDNTNTNIKIYGATFGENVGLYGDVDYYGCNFSGGATFHAGAMGSFIGCSSDVLIAGIEGFERAGNDANIGNSLSDPIPKTIVNVSSTPYTASVNQLVTVNPGGGEVIFNLPPATDANIGIDIYVSVEGAGNVVVTPDGTDTILGLINKTLTGDGNSWILSARSGDWRIF